MRNTNFISKGIYLWNINEFPHPDAFHQGLYEITHELKDSLIWLILQPEYWLPVGIWKPCDVMSVLKEKLTDEEFTKVKSIISDTLGIIIYLDKKALDIQHAYIYDYYRGLQKHVTSKNRDIYDDIKESIKVINKG